MTNASVVFCQFLNYGYHPETIGRGRIRTSHRIPARATTRHISYSQAPWRHRRRQGGFASRIAESGWVLVAGK